MKTIIAISIITTLFLVRTNSLFAQSIQGRIVTSENSPLEYVAVKLFKDSAMLQYALSDKNGVFILKDLSAKTRYLLQCSFAGYENFDTVFVTDSAKEMLIKMNPKVRELEGVVVSARKPLIERKMDRLVFNVQI